VKPVVPSRRPARGPVSVREGNEVELFALLGERWRVLAGNLNSGCSAALRDISARRHSAGGGAKREASALAISDWAIVLTVDRKFLEGPAAEGLNPSSARPISARGRFVKASLIIPDQLMTTVWPMLNADAHRAIAC